MNLVPRSTIWPGQLPTSTSGGPRPLLEPARPYLTVHYTGAGSWLDPDDTPTELRAIQDYAQGAGKPWEYNYVIDGQGSVFEYAGDYRAAHTAGWNEEAIGVLLLVGFVPPSSALVLEVPPVPMIVAFRDLRAWLVDTGRLANPHDMRQHRQMPGAATACPGAAVIAKWDQLLAPVPPPPTPPEDPMPTARRVRDPRYLNVFLVGAGPALHLSPELNATYAGVEMIVTQHPQLLQAMLHQSGLDHSDLVPVAP